MNVNKICSVEDCGKPVKAHGFCGMHNARNKRHGDPLAKLTFSTGESFKFVEETIIPYDGDECLFHPYHKGRPTISINGRIIVMSRYVCQRVNGAPPAEKMDAAHSCGRGHLGCITPKHLSWKTRAENVADMIDHGTVRNGEKNPLSKLTEEQVLKILSLKGTATHAAIGEMFGVKGTHITQILNGKRWGHIQKRMSG